MSKFELFNLISTSFTANNCEFAQALRLNFNSSKIPSINFENCRFRNFVNLTDHRRTEDLENLSFKNCNWFFEDRTKSSLLADHKQPKGSNKELESLKQSLLLLESLYSQMNLKYETRHFQRQLNFVYQIQGSFTRKERVALWWAHKSNDFGTDYTRGIEFTLIVAASFFLLRLTLFTILGDLEIGFFELECWNHTLGYFIDFINVTKWKYTFFGLEANGLDKFLTFLGRIFVGYGIYQTIAAFRIITKM